MAKRAEYVTPHIEILMLDDALFCNDAVVVSADVETEDPGGDTDEF